MDDETATGTARARQASAYTTGTDVTAFSVDDLRHAIGLMRNEIARLEAAIGEREGTRAAAESLFRL